MSDVPFQRERDIRSGKLDNEHPGYEEITGWLGRVPITWLPGLLINCVKQCVCRRVFKDEAALLRTVQKATDMNVFRSDDDRIHQLESALKECVVALEGCIKFWHRDSESKFYDAIMDSKDALTKAKALLEEK